MEYLDQINSHKYLFLEKLCEQENFSIFVIEGRVDYSKKENLNEILESAPSQEMFPIISDQHCKRYKMIFKNYLTYLVRKETFTTWNNVDEFIGNKIRKYSISSFYEFAKISSSIDYAMAFMDIEEYFHVQICCEDHIIDVITANDWEIEAIN